MSIKEIADFILKLKKQLLIIFIFSLPTFYAIIYFFIPEEYTSTSTILPVSDGSSGMLSSLMKNLKDLPLGIGGKTKNSDTDLFLSILYSREFLENISIKFNLKNDYNTDLMEENLKIIKKKLKAELTKTNSFEISYTHYDKIKCQSILNYIIINLNEKVIELNSFKSKKYREFIEKRYLEIAGKLKASEDLMEEFQNNYKVYEPKEQIKVLFNEVILLEKKLEERKIEKELLEYYSGISNPKIKLLEKEIEHIELNLNKMKTGSNELSLKVIPQRIKEYFRVYRELTINSTLLEFIIPVYEQAKFDEAKDTPILQIIDQPNLPERKSYPPRVLFTLLLSISSLIMFVFYKYYINK